MVSKSVCVCERERSSQSTEIVSKREREHRDSE